MITAETVKGALVGSWRLLNYSEWFSNGQFAVRGAEWAAKGTQETPGIGKLLESIAEKKFEPVLEAIELRIPREIGSASCVCINGTVTHEECDDCNGHECGDCSGSGKIEVVKDVGQNVFVGGGTETVVDPRYAPLLDGLTVMRDTSDPAPRAMLLGYDGAGVLVAIVMPYVEKVRR